MDYNEEMRKNVWDFKYQDYIHELHSFVEKCVLYGMYLMLDMKFDQRIFNDEVPYIIIPILCNGSRCLELLVGFSEAYYQVPSFHVTFNDVTHASTEEDTVVDIVHVGYGNWDTLDEAFEYKHLQIPINHKLRTLVFPEIYEIMIRYRQLPFTLDKIKIQKSWENVTACNIAKDLAIKRHEIFVPRLNPLQSAE